MGQLDREYDILAEQLNAGEITDKEYNAAARELAEDARAAAQEAAQDAYDDELARW